MEMSTAHSISKRNEIQKMYENYRNLSGRRISQSKNWKAIYGWQIDNEIYRTPLSFSYDTKTFVPSFPVGYDAPA